MSDDEQHTVSGLTGEHCTLNGSTDGDSLIWADRLRLVAARDAADRLRDLGHAGRIANESNVGGVLGLQAGVFEHLVYRVDNCADGWVNQASWLRPQYFAVDVLGIRRESDNEWYVDVDLQHL